jgi:subtilisin family serine protease
LERAIDYQLQDDPGRAVVVAAGNTAGAKTHYEWQFSAGSSTHLDWRVPSGGGKCDHEIEMWFPSRAEITVRIESPSGEISKPIRAFADEPPLEPEGNLVFVASTRFHPLNGDSLIYLWLNRGQNPEVTPGDWKIHLEATTAEPGTLHAWIELVIGPDEAQSSFGGTTSAAFTIGAPATSRYCLAVGNWNSHAQQPAATSSMGPTRDGRRKPEIVAPGTSIVSCHALGGRPGPAGIPWPATAEKSGTSMSAPLVAGLIACLFEENRHLTAPQVSKILAASCSGSEGYQPDVGYGVVNGMEALALVRQYIR